MSSTTDIEHSVKRITTEAFSLEPSSLVSLFEIDITDIKNNTLSGDTALISDDVLRFHNLNMLQGRTLWFQGKQYYAAPIIAEGFELSSSGELPRPKLSVTTVEGMGDEAVAQFASLKRAFISLGNLVGAKVTRIRTFYKFLDNVNFDPYGGFPFYISNFSSDTDGWKKVGGPIFRTTDIDNIYSLVFKPKDAGIHYTYKENVFTKGKKYKAVGQIYINPPATLLSSVNIGVGGVLLKTITGEGEWKDFEVEFKATGTNFDMYALWTDSWTPVYGNDKFYIKDVKLTKENKNVFPGYGHEPDQHARFPKEVFYIDSKTIEDKNTIQFELSSYLDVQNFKLPGRRIFATRCPWTYRGEGCCYEFKADSADDLDKQKQHFGATDHLPDFAPPIANANDEPISDEVSNYNPDNVTNPHTCNIASLNCPVEYNKQVTYPKGKIVYLEKNGDKYYFVSKGNSPVDDTTPVPVGFAPPHSFYWEPDQCSKTIAGCKIRWGTNGSAKKCTGTNCSGKTYANALLPFGGFPGTNTKTSIV